MKDKRQNGRKIYNHKHLEDIKKKPAAKAADLNINYTNSQPLIIAISSSSVRILIPKFCAFVSLLPAAFPATR